MPRDKLLLRGTDSFGVESTKPSHLQWLAKIVAKTLAKEFLQRERHVLSFAQPIAIASELIHSTEFAAFFSRFG